MINRGKRRSIQPMVVSSVFLDPPDASSKPSLCPTSKPKRIAFNEPTFEEERMQKLIEKNPELLPVGDIEPAFAPLISIGREVQTKVGAIDHLFINSQGYITIVETKLWRNPEARRQVVGQIIDYATELSHWNFDQLNKSVRAYNKDFRKADLGIVDTIRTQEYIAEEDEHEIVDTVSRNLKLGKFLLLIVGDGIRESVEDMVEYLQYAPNLQFTLALVELQIYQLKENQDNSELLIIPQIVTRTSEITRAVIKIEATDIKKVEVSVDKGPGVITGRFSLSSEAFYNKLPREYAKLSQQIEVDMEARGCRIDWKQASFMAKLPDPGGSGRQLSLFGVWKNGDLSTGLGWLPGQLKELGISNKRDFVHEFAVNTARLLNVSLSKKYPDLWEGSPNINTLSKCYPEFFVEVDKLIDNIRKGSQPEA